MPLCLRKMFPSFFIKHITDLIFPRVARHPGILLVPSLERYSVFLFCLAFYVCLYELKKKKKKLLLPVLKKCPYVEVASIQAICARWFW